MVRVSKRFYVHSAVCVTTGLIHVIESLTASHVWLLRTSYPDPDYLKNVRKILKDKDLD